MIQQRTTQVFDNWLFDLLLAANLSPNADAHVRSSAVKAKKDWKTGKKMVTPGKAHDVKALRVFNRLIKAPRPAQLLRECLSEADFTVEDSQ